MKDDRQIIPKTKAGSDNIQGTCKIWHLIFPYHDKYPEFGVEPSELLSLPPEKRAEHILSGFATKPTIEAVIVTYCISESHEEEIEDTPETVDGKYGYHHFHVLVKYRTPSDASAVRNSIGNNPHVRAVRQPKGQQDRSKYKAFLQDRIDYVMKKGKYEGKEWVVVCKTKGKFVTQSKAAERAEIIKEMETESSSVSIASTLIEHPEYDNPTSKTLFRARLIANKYRDAGYPLSRPVFLIYVTGKVLSGKTTKIHNSLNAAGIDFFAVGDENGLEEYAGEEALIIDDPIPAACSENMLTKMVDNEVVKLGVRYGLVPTLWRYVIVESPLSLNDLCLAYGVNRRVYDKLRGYVCEYWYCFAVTTEDERLTCFEGYSDRQEDGYYTRYDYLRVPVSRHFHPSSHTIRVMAKMFFSVTHIEGEIAEDFDDIVFTESEKRILCQIWNYQLQGITITSHNFTSLYRDAITEA